MAKFRLSNQAVADLADIWNYTFDTWSERRADKYYLLLLDTCKELAKKPELGKKYDSVHAYISGYRVAQHIIFYTVQEDEIMIVKILHSRMDLKIRLAE